MKLHRSAGARAPIFTTVSAAIFLSGCMTATPYQAPDMRLSDRYSVVRPVQQMSEADWRWWTHFGDPVLNKLVDEALVENLSLVEARSRVRQAEANLRGASSGISGDGRLEVDAASDGTEAGELGLSAIFDVFGRKRARTEAARARLQAEQLGGIDAQRRLLLRLAQSYIELRFNQQTLAERNRDLRSRRVTLRDITTQKENGVATELDVVRAKALVAEIQVDLPKLGANIVRERNRISTLLGKPVGSLNVDLSYQGRQPAPRGVANLGVPADLLRTRPDVRRAERLYAAAVSDIDSARAARYPSLSLSGVVRAPFGGGSTSETLTAGLAVPVFSQGTLAASVDASEESANQAYLQWRSAVLSAVEEVETSLSALHASYQAVEAARRVVSLNEQALALSRRLLESRGNLTVLDLLDRERTLTNSRTILARNQRDVAIDFVTLRVALGSGITVRPKAEETN